MLKYPTLSYYIPLYQMTLENSDVRSTTPENARQEISLNREITYCLVYLDTYLYKTITNTIGTSHSCKRHLLYGGVADPTRAGTTPQFDYSTITRILERNIFSSIMGCYASSTMLRNSWSRARNRVRGTTTPCSSTTSGWFM